MSFSYYIKKNTRNFLGPGKYLMDEIYICCIKRNDGRNKIHTVNQNHIVTDILFEDLNKLKIILSEDEIKKMNCGKMSRDYLYDSYINETRIALISIDNNTGGIHTLLTFYFNHIYECIEIDTFCSKPGGGTIFNFLINAIKCGIDKCKKTDTITHTFEQKFRLKSLNNPRTLGFYAKYGFQAPYQKVWENDELVPLERKLSVDSIHDLNKNNDMDDKNNDMDDKNNDMDDRKLSVDSIHDLNKNNDMDDALMVDLSSIEKETKKQNKKSSNESDDDNIDYYDIIDNYFNRNRNRYYTNMDLRDYPKTNTLFEPKYNIARAVYDYNNKLNKMNKYKYNYQNEQYSPSNQSKKKRKRGSPKRGSPKRIKKGGSRKNKTNKKTKKYKYKPNKYKQL